MTTRKDTFKTIPVGTKVSWHYRSAIGHGTVAGVHEMGTNAAGRTSHCAPLRQGTQSRMSCPLRSRRVVSVARA